MKATARDTSKISEFSELSDLDTLELDFTVEETMLRCREMVPKRTGGKIDIIINNAGVEFVSPLLDVGIAEAKKLYDVHVQDPLAMAQAFAPLLIKAKGMATY